MLIINNLSINFSGHYLFEGINFNLEPNSRIGLIGRNGTGKTTLLKIIYGLEQPEEGTVVTPSGYKIGYLPQEGIIESEQTVYNEVKTSLNEISTIETTINDLTDELSKRNDYTSESYHKIVQKFTDLSERFKILGGNSIEAEIEKVLSGLGFEFEEFTRNVQEFSGGWQMRIELAKILLNKPDCILLDEPTNHLDIESIQWLQGFLNNYFGSVIIVSHDRNFLNKATNRTIEISNGKIYDISVPYSKFIEIREQQKEQQFQAYKNQQKQIDETEKFIERFRYKATLATRVQSRIKQLEKIERIVVDEEDKTKIKLRFPEPPRSGRLVSEVRNLTKIYGEKVVLSGIDFSLERGDKIAFVGKNGEGKSTLSRILAGKESYNGTVENGYNVLKGYYAQHQSELLDMNSTVFEVIDNIATGDMRQHVRGLLGAFLFSGDSVYKKVKVLSGGEKSRLALAKMLLEPINFLILDEPTNHLDMIAKDVLKNALMDYQGTLIIVSHDIDFLDGLTTRTVYFKNKTIKEYRGNINEFLEKHNLETLKELEISQKVKPEDDKGFVKKDKAARLQQKEFQKEENRLKKLITACELNIEKFEEEIAVYESEFSRPEFMYDLELSKQKQEEYFILRKNLDGKMIEWTELNEKLEDFIKSS